MSSPLFDPYFYGSYSDLQSLNLQELDVHWRDYGLPEGRLGSEEHFRDLYPDFHLASYRALNPDLADLADVELLIHWHIDGMREGRQCYDIFSGVNLFGYFDEDFGLAQNAHSIAASLEHCGIPFERFSVGSGRSKRGVSSFDSDRSPRYRTNIVCLNPDNLESLFLHYPYRQSFQNRRNIALWLWEMERVPNQFISSASFFDEIWTASRFCQSAMAAALPVPVRYLPIPTCNMPQTDGPDSGRSSCATFEFLFVCDLASSYHRKNPDGLIRAFHLAFGTSPEADVHLILKIRNHEMLGVEAQLPFLIGLIETLGLESRVTVVSDDLDAVGMDKLFADCDCYVSLHRSEGFGLTILEALLRGKQVIATDYSGNLDFCTDENVFLVPYSLESPPPEDPCYGGVGGEWAEPDLAVAARLMREVAEGARRPQCATALAEQYSIDTCAGALGELLRCHGVRAGQQSQ